MAEVLKYTIIVASGLDTGRMVVVALATTYTYTEMVILAWGSATCKMKRYGEEAQIT
jgi:hypothetical protein